MTESAENTQRFALSATAIKTMACVAMFLDHMVKAWNMQGAIRFVCAKVIGRIAFPLFAFFIVEGFLHTRNRLQYLLRLVLFAALSEYPFDRALYHMRWYPKHQNTLWTLAMGLLLLFCLDYVAQKKDLHYLWAVLWFFACGAAFGVAAEKLHLDYGARGVLAIALLYMLRDVRPRVISLFWGCVCINLSGFKNPGAFLALLPLHFYDGTRGRSVNKYVFYAFYPAHLLLLFLIYPLRLAW